MYCPSCGKELKNDIDFCGNCGWSKNDENDIFDRVIKALFGILVVLFTKLFKLLLAAVKKIASLIGSIKLGEIKINKKFIAIGSVIVILIIILLRLKPGSSKNGDFSLKMAQGVDETIVPDGWQGDYYYSNGAMLVSKWIEYGTGWCYLKEDGRYARSEWLLLDGSYYYFHDDGMMAANEWVDNDYYVGTDGKMLVSAVTPDGYYVGKTGKYIPIQY